jgi:hypothetical protein
MASSKGQQGTAAMNNRARIERMTRELNAEPAAQFFAGLINLFARRAPKEANTSNVGAPARIRLSYK